MAWEDKQNQARLKSTLKKQKIAHPKGVKGKYIHFCGDERKLIIEQNPDMAIKDVTCILGTRWVEFKKSTDPVNINRMVEYTRLYEEDRKRYQEEKSKLEPEKPKKDAVINTAYKAFCSEERSSGHPITIVELNNKWKNVKRDQVLMDRYKEIAGKV